MSASGTGNFKRSLSSKYSSAASLMNDLELYGMTTKLYVYLAEYKLPVTVSSMV